MNTTHQFPGQVKSIYVAPASCNSFPRMHAEREGADSYFSIMDSAEMELFSLMSPARTEDAAMLYVDKGKVTVAYGLKTYILSKGMLLYKAPQVTLRLISFSKDCHFKVFCFAPEFAIAGGMPITHIETITEMALEKPVINLDTLTAATVTVLFWLLQKKLRWVEVAQSPDETIQHVFSLLTLEIVSSYKRNRTDDPDSTKN
jgi:hypothetical protein